MRRDVTPDLTLSAATGIVAVAAVALLGVAHLLPPVPAVVAAAAVGGAAVAPVVWPGARGARHRRSLCAVLVPLGCVVVLVGVERLGGHQPPQRVDLARDLARALPIVLAAQLLAADRFRHVVMSLALSAATAALALSAQPGRAAVLPVLVAWSAGVLAAARAHILWLRGTTDVDATAEGQVGSVGAWRRVAVLAGVPALVATLVTLLVPIPRGLTAPHQVAGGGAGSGAPSRDGSSGRSVQGYTGGALDMRARGELPPTPVAQVSASSDPLWRGVAYTRYDGMRWTATFDSAFGPSVQPGPYVVLSGREQVEAIAGNGRLVTAELTPLPAYDGVVLAPGTPGVLDVYGSVVRVPGGFRVAAEDQRSAAYRVTAWSTSHPATDLVRTQVRDDGAAVPEGSLQLSGTVTARTRGLAARLVAGARNRLEATRAVETYLRRHERYDLDSPVPPAGSDAVDHFLFEAHTGFCEQFAAAEVVLLRAAGVPARMATGYAYGTTDDGVRTYRTSDLHAWVEVWYPGVGWVQSDPTAGATRVSDHGAAERLRDWLTSWRGLVAAVLVAGAGLSLLAVSFRRRRAAKKRRRDVAAAPVVAAFERLERRLADVGRPREPSESVRELATRPELVAVADALSVVEQTSYGARPPADHVARAAVAQLDVHARRLGDLKAGGRKR